MLSNHQITPVTERKTQSRIVDKDLLHADPPCEDYQGSELYVVPADDIKDENLKKQVGELAVLFIDTAKTNREDMAYCKQSQSQTIEEFCNNVKENRDVVVKKRKFEEEEEMQQKGEDENVKAKGIDDYPPIYIKK